MHHETNIAEQHEQSRCGQYYDALFHFNYCVGTLCVSVKNLLGPSGGLRTVSTSFEQAKLMGGVRCILMGHGWRLTNMHLLSDVSAGMVGKFSFLPCHRPLFFLVSLILSFLITFPFPTLYGVWTLKIVLNCLGPVNIWSWKCELFMTCTMTRLRFLFGLNVWN